MSIRILRRISQIAFFLLFVSLLLLTRFSGAGSEAADINRLDYPVRVFLEIDPLHALTQLLANWSLHPALALSLLVLIPTFFLGRVFCGWVCPLGALNHFFSRFPRSSRAWRPYSSGQKLKYYILLVILTASFAGIQLAGWLDPISLTIRSLSVSIFPALGWVIGGTTVFQYGAFIGAIFIVILALNRIKGRFFCRYLCPLGALLGVCAKSALLRIGRKEGPGRREGLCCPQGADPGGNWRSAECVGCFNCQNIEVKGRLSFSFLPARPVETKGINLERRRLVGALAIGFVLPPLLKAGQKSALGGGAKDPALIRPPGACNEQKFQKLCLRCGECMKICPTNALHPALGEGGVGAAFTPILVASIGYCQYSCTLCGQVCPTEAIQRISLEQKKALPSKGGIKIGTAFIDRGRCLPWAMGTPCIVCQEHCPISPKAIKLEKIKSSVGKKKSVSLQRPYIDPALCNGCGICENVCPVGGKRGVYITSADETRDNINRMLLSAKRQ